MTIESAKQFLKENGYYVDNLWHIDDVKIHFKCTDEEAYDVLDDVLRLSIEGINNDIQNVAWSSFERKH